MTWALIGKFLLKPRNLLIIAAIVTVLAFSAKIYNSGKDKGFKQANVETLNQDSKEVATETKHVQQELVAVGNLRATVRTKVQAEQVKIAKADAQLSELGSVIDSATAQALLIPDADLQRHITAALKVRAADDGTAGFYENELREIDLRVTIYGPLRQSVDVLHTRSQALEAQYSLAQEQIGLEQQATKIVLDWGNSMHGHYVKAFNLAQPRLGFWGKLGVKLKLKKKPTLELPDPVTLGPPDITPLREHDATPGRDHGGKQ